MEATGNALQDNVYSPRTHQQLDEVGVRMIDMGTNMSDIEVRPQGDGIRVTDSDDNAQVSCPLVDVIPKIVKHGSFPPRCDSLQNIEIALLTVPLVVICESVSRCLPTSWFSKLCLHFKNWIYSQASYRFVQFSHC